MSHALHSPSLIVSSLPPPHAPASSASLRLASVELALCMHPLDPCSRLSLARCCRRLLADCREPFAWKHCEPILMHSARLAELGPRLHRSLARRAGIELRWSSALTHEQLTSLPELRAIEVRGGTQGLQFAAALTSLQSLRTVRLSVSHEYLPLLLALLRLPRLDTLSVQCDSDICAVPPDVPPLSSLTDLTVDGKHCAQLLASCSRLRRLRLGHVSLHARPWCELLDSPGLQTLTELSLEQGGIIAASTMRDACAAAIGLPQLASLRMGQCFVRVLLRSQLAGAGSLREVHVGPIQPLGRSDRELWGWPHSSLGDIEALLAAAPQLSIRLQLPPSFADWLAQADRAFVTSTQQDLREHEWEPWMQMAALPRVSIVQP